MKGILSTEDALRVRESGADGLYVSNHGGRQLDSAPASVQMLPAIRAAVGDDFAILFDSGVRNGEAVIKALALGADFVMIGRPYLYGIAGGGAQGLDNVIDMFARQIDIAMAQLGVIDVNAIDRRVICELDR